MTVLVLGPAPRWERPQSDMSSIVDQQDDLFEDVPRKESALQRVLVKMLNTMLRPDVLMRHITAGGMDARTGAKLKQMGRLAGCADLEFMWLDGNALRVLFLELK